MSDKLVNQVNDMLGMDLTKDKLHHQSLTILKNLLELAENNDFSKKGFYVELVNGVHDDYVCTVTDRHKEITSVDVEKMAYAGNHRQKLKDSKDGLPSEFNRYPRMLADAEVKVKKHVQNT